MPTVPTASLVTPGGQYGTTGTPAWTLTTADFTVPAVGATVDITVKDSSWMTVGETLWIANASGSGQAGALKIQAISGTLVTLLNVGSTTAGLANPTSAGLLRQTTGKTTDFLDGTNSFQDLASSPSIGLMRLRSFNAIGNPNFEVTQRNVGAMVAIASGAASAWAEDRWIAQKSGTMTLSVGVPASGSNIVAPGTSLLISSRYLRVSLTAQQTSLGTSDYVVVGQNIEGPMFRELIGDVHSTSLLVYCDVALKFTIYLRDFPVTKTLVKLVSIPAATWTYVTLPNLPVWASGGNWTIAPGVAGYNLGIGLAAGSTLTAPAVDTWQNGSFLGAPGSDNFAAKPVNTNFWCAFIQHEPGPNCTQFIDKPFNQNLLECQRYFQKSVPYGTLPTAGSGSPCLVAVATGANTSAARGGAIIFPTRMAKTPAGTVQYNGTLNTLYADLVGSVSVSVVSCTDMGIRSLTLASTLASVQSLIGDWIADTGW